MFIRISGVSLILGALISPLFRALFGAVFLIIGFIGLYTAHPQRRGLLLLVGIVLKIIVIISLVILDLINLVLQIPSVEQLSLLHVIAISVTFILELAANITIGISIIRLKTFPPLAGILVIVSMILMLVTHQWGSYVYYGCLIWIGYLMARGIRNEYMPNTTENVPYRNV